MNNISTYTAKFDTLKTKNTFNPVIGKKIGETELVMSEKY